MPWWASRSGLWVAMNVPVRVYAALAGSDRGELCKVVTEHGDCSGYCGDDEVAGGDEGVAALGGLLLFVPCM